MELIYHITRGEDWRAALGSRDYRMSTKGKTLDEVGFIHCSRADQVEGVANAVYRGAHGLVLLTIAVDRVVPEIRDDRVGVGETTFPHIYGPLNVDAVVAVTAFEPGTDGRFTFAPEALQDRGMPW